MMYTRQAFQDIAPILLAERGKTIRDMGVTAHVARTLEAEGVLKRIGKTKTGQRGRPANKYALTDKGRKRAKRLNNA